MTESIGPKFCNPMSLRGTAALGEFSVVWGQIDFMVTQCIGFLLKTEMPVTNAYLKEQTTGQKVNLLRRIRGRSSDSATQALIKKFLTDVSPLIAKRNHLVHGVWGFENVPPQSVAGCHFHKGAQQIYADDLPGMIQSANALSHAIHEIMIRLSGQPLELIDKRTVTFWIGEVTPPGWTEPST